MATATRQRHRMGEKRQQAGNSGVAPGGTIGGKPRGLGLRPGQRPIAVGDVGYLWILVAIEVAAIFALRKYFRRYHGG